MGFNLLSLGILPLIVIAAAISDWRTHTISNKLSVILILGFPVVFFVSGFSISEIPPYLMVGAAAFLIGISLFALGFIGGGDTKLFTGVALWMGWPEVIHFMGYMVIAGGVLAVTLVIFKKLESFTALLPSVIFTKLPDADKGLPYGVAIAAGALIAFPETALFKAAFTQ